MKKLYLFIIFILFATACSWGQKTESFTVPAGTRVDEFIPFSTRFQYPEFMPGKVYYKSGNFSAAKFNYNLLVGEMQYLQLRDTLTIANPGDIAFMVVSADTFYYDHKYLQMIKGGKVKVAKNQKIELQLTVKHDSYGAAGSSSSIESLGALHSGGTYYKLIANEDRIFQKQARYFIAVSNDDFVDFNRKKVLQLFAGKQAAIQKYLKVNKVNFKSGEGLLPFADFLENL